LLIFDVAADKQHLQLVHHDTRGELKDLQLYFKKRQQGYFHNILYKRKLWDGYDKFIDDQHRIGIGLWREVYYFGEKYDYEVEIRGLDGLLNLEFTKDKSDKFASVMLDGTNPQIEAYDYQLEALHRGLKYKFCAQELATSAGKTLIFFLYLSFLKRKGIISKDKKAILIVPKVSLVNQTADAFETEYQTGLVNWNIHRIGGKNEFSEKKFAECDLVITTYQSVILDDGTPPKRGKKKIERRTKPEFFKNFSVICIDEAHTSRGDSIRNILLASTNAEYKLGLSGTIQIEEQFSDFFKIQEYLGPLSMKVRAKFLMDNDYSADVHVKMLKLKYPKDEVFVQKYAELKAMEVRPPGKVMYDMEKEFIISYEPRINFIAKMCETLPGNKLVLFINVKDKYGQRIQDKIRETNEKVYYIDGGVNDDDRRDYREILEANTGIVLVASFGTFSTGINLKNVNYIIFAESYKSEITVRQSIGRGMRKLKGKYKITILDLVDDLDGYIVKHGKIREKIYKEQEFTTSKHEYDLTPFR
jgi:superfamily II DNA or RNA helicase